MMVRAVRTVHPGRQCVVTVLSDALTRTPRRSRRIQRRFTREVTSLRQIRVNLQGSLDPKHSHVKIQSDGSMLASILTSYS